MFASYNIKVVNNHLLIDDEQRLLIDMGSPISFHASGSIRLGEETFNVKNSIPYVTSQYLSTKVGCQIDGILGMDLIRQHTLHISLKDGFIIWDSDSFGYETHFQTFPLNPIAGGLLAITVTVNLQTANMIVDTAAPISYIGKDFVHGLESEGIQTDFSPFEGDFQTEIYQCEVDTLTYHGTYNQRFGILPKGVLSATLQTLQVDGILGFDLFQQFRLQIENGLLYLPPQGI